MSRANPDDRRVNVGMVGGALDAGIGESHRIGMRVDDRYRLVAGVFSRSREKSLAAARAFGVDPLRVYATAEEMARAESLREDGIEAVSVVTSNEAHYPVSKVFLEHGIHVICDKPLTSNLPDALELYRLAREKQRLLVLTHNYSAYSMVRHAARLVRDGELGDIRIVHAEHPEAWAAGDAEATGSKQAAWRMDPDIGGKASVVYDLGTHAHNLLRVVTGLEVAEVSAEFATVFPGRRVIDDAHVQLRMSNGARGTLWACMAATGNEHGLRIRVFGSKASLEWSQDDYMHLTLRYLGGRRVVYTHGMSGLSDEAARATRTDIGHPEGLFEAFANVYREAADAIVAMRVPGRYEPLEIGMATARDGVFGLAFVEAACRSAERDGAWTPALPPI